MTRKHAPPEQRRAQILSAALDCFAARGYHATTMDDLAHGSGLSKGSLYWHFQSKQDVFLSLFDAFAAELFDAWEAAESHEQDSLGILQQQAEIVLKQTFLKQRPLLLAWAEFLSHPEARERMAAIYRTSRAKLAEILQRGVTRGELRPLSVESGAALCTAFIEGLLLQSMVDPEFDPTEHLTELWQVFRKGIAA